MLENLSLFLGAFADAFIGPNLLVPGEPFMIAAGYQLYAGSIMGILMVVAGGFLGDQASFGVGRRYGRRVQNALLERRPSLRRRVAQARLMLKRNERKVLVLARLLGPVAWVVPFIAGTGGTNWQKFTIYSSIGLVLGVGQFVFWGYMLAMGVESFPFLNEIRIFFSEHSGALMLLIVVVVFYVAARRCRVRQCGIWAALLLIVGLCSLNYTLFFEKSDDFVSEQQHVHSDHITSLEFKAYAGKSAYFNAQAINVLYFGESPEEMMLETGWIKNKTFSRDDISLVDYVGLLKAGTPPVSDLYWNGQPQYLAFQQPGTLSKRNHIRWWPVQSLSGNQQETIWLGAISFDDGLGLTMHSGLVTLLHTIDADVDKQRDVLGQLVQSSTRWQAQTETMTTPVVLDNRHDYFTDGGVLVIEPVVALAADI